MESINLYTAWGLKHPLLKRRKTSVRSNQSLHRLVIETIAYNKAAEEMLQSIFTPLGDGNFYDANGLVFKITNQSLHRLVIETEAE